MPILRSSIKDLRRSRKRTEANKKIKIGVKSLFKKSADLIKANKKSEAMETIRLFQKAVDKAAKRHVISFNAASRKKAALAKAFKKIK